MWVNGTAGIICDPNLLNWQHSHTHTHRQFAHTTHLATWVNSKYTRSGRTRSMLGALLDMCCPSLLCCCLKFLFFISSAFFQMESAYNGTDSRDMAAKVYTNSSVVLCCLSTAIEANTFHPKMVRALNYMDFANGKRAACVFISLFARIKMRKREIQFDATRV